MKARNRNRRRKSGGNDGGGSNRGQSQTKGGGNRNSNSDKGGGGGGRNRRRKGRGRRKNRRTGAGFWGDTEKLPPLERDVTITDDASAVPRSLGSPPLPGHEKIAEHYFTLVYDRAVQTAGALAAAGGLIGTDQLGGDPHEEETEDI